MCDWTDGAWPHGGSLETEKLQLTEIIGHGDIGNPEWYFSYMRKDVMVWKKVAALQSRGGKVSENGYEWGSDELKNNDG